MKTKKIKILQYRADKQDEHWLDDAIAGWTRLFNKNTPPYSHSEICFPGGLCFSASSRGGKKFVGTRFEDFEVVTRNKDRWDIYSKFFTEQEISIMLQRAKKISGKKYFFIGIFLDFFMPFGWLSQLIGKTLNQWYCSQAVYYCLKGRRTRVSPRRLTKWLMEDGFVLEL